MEVTDPSADPRAEGLGSRSEARWLFRVMEAGSRAEHVEEVLAPALDLLTEGLGFDAAAILLDDEHGVARCRATRSLSEVAGAALEAFAAGHKSEAALVYREDLRANEHGLGALVSSDGIASAGLAVIVVRGQPAGCVVVLARRRRRMDEGQATLIEATAAQIGRAVELIALRSSEAQMRAASERNADRMRRLVRVTAALTSATTAAAVAELIIEEAHEALGSDSAGVWLLDERKTRLEILAGRGFAPGMKERIASFPIATENPLCVAVRQGEPIWLEHWAEFARRFPDSEQRVRSYPKPGPMAFSCLPLRIEDQTIGGIALTFFRERVFDSDDRAFIWLFSQHCAQGIERARLYEKAMAAIRVRDDFLSVAGHELRTPLSTMLLQTQLISDSADDKAGRSLRDRIAPVQRTLRRLIKLADDVLDVSRIRAGRLRIEVERVELTNHVREVVARLLEGLRKDTSVRLDTQGPIEGQWDPLRIEQIVVNLITNAAKYGGGSPIDVRVAPCPAGAELIVRDYGIGIAPADQARIFERFERSVEPREFAGLGLGLWIVREIVQAHGGTIAVRSDLGQGAEFSVTLPLAPV